VSTRGWVISITLFALLLYLMFINGFFMSGP